MLPTDPLIYPHTYTYIEEVGYVCNDCGAWAEEQDEVVHYPSCSPGLSERWQRYYTETPDIEPEGDSDGPEVD